MRNRLIVMMAAGAGLTAFLLGANPVYAADGAALATKNGCLACHNVDKKVLGPAFKDVGKKYQGHADAVAYLTGKIKGGSSGVWGPIPMPANSPKVSDADVKDLAEWILSLS
jgi:cytochrome c